MCYYGSSLTGKTVGVKIDYSQKRDKENIDSFVMWCISDFGFRLLPIYVTEVIIPDNENIYLYPLKCYIKSKNTKTILTPTSKPSKYDPNVLLESIEDFFPDTEFISWVFRDKKPANMEKRKPYWEIIETPDLTDDKKISLLSVDKRKQRNKELEDLNQMTEFFRRKEGILLKEKEKIIFIKEKLNNIEKRKEKTEESFLHVKNKILSCNCNKIEDKDIGSWFLVGWKEDLYNSIVLLKNVNTNKDIVVRSNTRMEKFLNTFSPYFNVRDFKKDRLHFYVSIKNDFTDSFKIIINNKKSFINEEGRKIVYYNILVDLNLNEKNKYRNRKNNERGRTIIERKSKILFTRIKNYKRRTNQ